jgi:hypothetical protein
MAKSSDRDCETVSDAFEAASLGLERLSARPQRRRRKETARQIGAKGAGKGTDADGQRVSGKTG